jgi:hypothetical protein
MSKLRFKSCSSNKGEYQKTVSYHDLKDLYMFLRRDYKGGYRVYTKMCDAYAVDDRTGKDAIFLPHERVVPLYPSISDEV